MQRKIILIGGVFVVFLLVLAAVNSLLGSKNSGPGVCGQFISAVQKGKFSTSYQYFTDYVKSQQPLSDWEAQASGMQQAYGSAKPQKVYESTGVGALTKMPEAQINYTISNGSSHFSLSCYTSKVKDKYLIYSFTSKLLDQ